MTNKDRIIRIVLWLTVTVAGTVLCLFMSIPSAIVLVTVSLILYISEAFFIRRRADIIFVLCDKIDHILHGADSVSFDEYNEDELSVLSAEIHKMTIKLREQNAQLIDDKVFLKESLEDISHQLRTPLTSCSLILSMLRTPNLPPNRRIEYIRELSELLSHMQWLIETLLSISRLNAGAVVMQSEMVDCRLLIRKAFEPLNISIELRGIETETIIEGEPSFCGDMRYCTEAMQNILKNCVEHTPSGGKITVKAYENGIYTGILISDSGDGIPEEDIPKIFERFYSGKNLSTGYGIGLAFAKRVIVSQNGSITVRNSPYGGAEFDLRFYKTTV